MEQLVRSCVAVVALLVPLVLTGCPQAGKPNKAPKTVRIGALLPLSGKKAPIGLQQRRAFELAEERLNADGNIKVKFLFVDTKSDPKVGETGACKLIEQERLPVVFAFPCDVVYKVQPVADKTGTLLMACNMDPHTAQLSPWTFRVFPNLRQQTDVMLKHIGKGDGKRAAVIRLNAPSANCAVAELLMPGLKANDWQVVASIAYDKKSRDYKAAAGQTRAANPDVILLYVDREAVPPLLKLLKKNDFSGKVKIVGGISFAPPFKLPAKVLEGVTVIAPACALSGRPRVKASRFGQEFLKRDGKPPHFLAAFCFDGAMLVGRGLQEKEVSASALQAYLKTVKNYSGVTGSIRFDDAGDAKVKWEVGVYKNGKLVCLPKSLFRKGEQ